MILNTYEKRVSECPYKKMVALNAYENDGSEVITTQKVLFDSL